jgi:hypothetical protein
MYEIGVIKLTNRGPKWGYQRGPSGRPEQIQSSNMAVKMAIDILENSDDVIVVEVMQNQIVRWRRAK